MKLVGAKRRGARSMQTKIKTWMAQPWRSAVLAAAVALFLLQAPSAAWAKGKQVDKANKAEHSAGKAKSKVKSKAKSTAENHGHKKNPAEKPLIKRDSVRNDTIK